MKKLIVIAVLTIATTLTACTTPQNAPTKAAEQTQEAPKVTDEAPEEDEEKPEVTEAPTEAPVEAVTEEPEASKAPAPTVSEFEGFVGEWAGTAYEIDYDDEKEEYVETDKVLTALLDICQDGTWSLVFDGGSFTGKWENIASSGRAINLLVEVSYSDELQDEGWTLICIDKTILHVNHWGSYDIELTRI